MLRRKVLLLGALSLAAGSAWAALGDSYVGEVATDWSTTGAVTVRSSQDGGYLGFYPASSLISGQAFQASGLPGNKGLTDGWNHSANAGYSWLVYPISPMSLSPASVNSKAWVEFSFDQVYSLKDITVWNGAGDEANSFQRARAWKDTVISWSTDGDTWNSMNYTLNQPPIGGDANFFSPSDPAIPFANNAKYVVFSGTANYGDTQFMSMSEVRFNVAVPEPSTLALLSLSGLGLLLRRKR